MKISIDELIDEFKILKEKQLDIVRELLNVKSPSEEYVDHISNKQKYYYITGHGTIAESIYQDDIIDKRRLLFHNMFMSEESANERLKEIKKSLNIDAIDGDD